MSCEDTPISGEAQHTSEDRQVQRDCQAEGGMWILVLLSGTLCASSSGSLGGITAAQFFPEQSQSLRVLVVHSS